MTIYIVFRKNYIQKKGELLGMLIERRKYMRGKSLLDSGSKWAKIAFGHLVKDKKDIYVLPKEIKVNKDEKLLVEKGIFSKEEYLHVLNRIKQEMN